MKEPIKVIDLFAGPGGLGEGFSSLYSEDHPSFKIGVSVEKEVSAHSTLTLRAFFRQFSRGKAPDDYYTYLEGKFTRQELFRKWPEQARKAKIETLQKPRALGKDNELIDSAISAALEKNKPWVLIGGPPCQAYSLVGRARNKGIKSYKAETDDRHFLYQEYLRIIAKFQPTVFVMENVKGMLSSKVGGKPIFHQILSDLGNPSTTTSEQTKGAKYRIYSFSTPVTGDLFNPVFEPRDFIIRSEDFGIPQTRHRVILLGIREDQCIDGKRLTLQPSTPPSVQQLIDRMPRLRSGLSKEPDSPERWEQVLGEIQAELVYELQKDPQRKPLVDSLKSVHINFSLPTADRGKRFIPFHGDSTPYGQMSVRYGDWFRDYKLHGYVNHDSRGHMRQDLARYLYSATFALQGTLSSPRLQDFPTYLLPAHANRNSGSFVDRFKVQLRHKPASTITSHISKDGHYYIHYDPSQCRSLTVREAARMQTFPDNYFFEGNRTQQYVQVGNAVPPFLAKQIAVVVYSLLGS